MDPPGQPGGGGPGEGNFLNAGMPQFTAASRGSSPCPSVIGPVADSLLSGGGTIKAAIRASQGSIFAPIDWQLRLAQPVAYAP